MFRRALWSPRCLTRRHLWLLSHGHINANLAAIPRHLLRDLYLTSKAKESLTRGRCPDCQQPLEAIDTWERACSNPACDYVFNLYYLYH